MLSELEKVVLEAVLLGKRKVNEISKFCGIPELTVNEVLRRLVERGYLTDELVPTTKAYDELKWVDTNRTPSFYGENLKKFLKIILDILIILAILHILTLLI